MKIVINRCFGGFGLSDLASDMYCAAKNIAADNFFDRDVPRNDPVLVEIIEKLGTAADGRYSELKIVDIPDDVDWIVEEYDGMEYVAERHRVWS